MLNNYNNTFIQIFDDISTQKFLELFKTNPKLWLGKLIDKLLEKENEDFHVQIEMLSFTIPKVKSMLEYHSFKVKELTYQCFLYYTNFKESKELKILSEIVFNFISSTVDELLYSEHSDKEKELLKKSSVNCIILINNTINLDIAE